MSIFCEYFSLAGSVPTVTVPYYTVLSLLSSPQSLSISVTITRQAMLFHYHHSLTATVLSLLAFPQLSVFHHCYFSPTFTVPSLPIFLQCHSYHTVTVSLLCHLTVTVTLTVTTVPLSIFFETVLPHCYCSFSHCSTYRLFSHYQVCIVFLLLLFPNSYCIFSHSSSLLPFLHCYCCFSDLLLTISDK